LNCSAVWVQSRFAETRFAETLTLTLNPNFGESGFGESGRHRSMRVHPSTHHLNASCNMSAINSVLSAKLTQLNSRLIALCFYLHGIVPDMG